MLQGFIIAIDIAIDVSGGRSHAYLNDVVYYHSKLSGNPSHRITHAPLALICAAF
jgi:hypothetical protein